VNIRFLLGILVTLGLAVPIPAFAQAAAESALTNALSSSATVKAGSTLNRALNQGSTNLGTRIQERTSGLALTGMRQAPRAEVRNSVPATLSAGTIHSASSPAVGGISIRGGEITCTANPPVSHSLSAKTERSVDCHRPPSAAKSATNTDTYKSFVMLPAPQ
jgi:hypothetical protein